MLSKFFNKKSRGFTLVELLIVVAIIGVLSTLGVPTFRRMIQKSKKSEAKVNLGGIFTAESAFQAEYNTYGNNLARVGYEMEGNPATLTYKVGFMLDSSCADVAAADIAPLVTDQRGIALNAAFPAYYTAAFAPSAGYNGLTGAVTACDGLPATHATVAADGSTFLAAAVGAIAPAVSRATPLAGQGDLWTMDQQRNLSNLVDGVQ